jgi:hypothetical protein
MCSTKQAKKGTVQKDREGGAKKDGKKDSPEKKFLYLQL